MRAGSRSWVRWQGEGATLSVRALICKGKTCVRRLKLGDADRNAGKCAMPGRRCCQNSGKLTSISRATACSRSRRTFLPPPEISIPGAAASWFRMPARDWARAASNPAKSTSGGGTISAVAPLPGVVFRTNRAEVPAGDDGSGRIRLRLGESRRRWGGALRAGRRQSFWWLQKNRENRK